MEPEACNQESKKNKQEYSRIQQIFFSESIKKNNQMKETNSRP